MLGSQLPACQFFLLRSDYSALLQVSVYEMANQPFFDKLPLLIEDFIKDNGGSYNCTPDEGAVHVIVDRCLVTGQNTASTGLAIQNLVWLMKN